MFLFSIIFSICIRIAILYLLFTLVAITVFFNQSTYRIDEGDLSVHCWVFLSNPSLNDTTVQIINVNGSAAGE